MDKVIYYGALGIVGYLGLCAFVALHVLVPLAYRQHKQATAEQSRRRAV